MNNIRQAAVAGSFYPSDPNELRNLVHDYLNDAESSKKIPKAIIAPHAGYMYSGPIAASAYTRLHSAGNHINKVVLIGPSHRVGFQGLSVTRADAYATPLGTVSIDRETSNQLADLSFVHVLDKAHAHEHSLEVHLPFLQEVLGDFKLLPIITGDGAVEEVSEVIDRVWGDQHTLIVISSDLSHYHDYSSAQKLDTATSQAIEALDWNAIGFESACGRIAINGLLHSLRKRRLKAATIDLRNSGDTAGSRDRVVGYGAYVVNL